MATRVRLVEIGTEAAGQRLDNYLIRLLKGLPKSRVYRIIRKGEVRINGRRVKPHVRLAPGDTVRIPPISHLPVRQQAVGTFKNLNETIIYEDNFLLVLNKPAGMAVHGGSGVNVGIIESLRHALPDGGDYELVHRLDRDTSGCLMIAKRRGYLRLVQGALRQTRQIGKTYLAVVYGKWPDDPVTANHRIETRVSSGGERISRVSKLGKPAITEFSKLAGNSDLSLVSASLLTGRTHQIRVHARYLRHPLVGDPKYGDEIRDRDLKPPRMMLHASSLSIPALGDHPALEIHAPLDNAMGDFIAAAFGENYLNRMGQSR